MDTEMLVEKLKRKLVLSRDDIENLLGSIGKPGEKRDEKMQAVIDLGKSNRQGHGLELTIESYREW